MLILFSNNIALLVKLQFKTYLCTSVSSFGGYVMQQKASNNFHLQFYFQTIYTQKDFTNNSAASGIKFCYYNTL